MVHDAFREYQKFAWQEGYGGFSVSSSQAGKTIAYIQRQKGVSAVSELNVLFTAETPRSQRSRREELNSGHL